MAYSRIVLAAVAAWGFIAAAELASLYGVLRVFSWALGPELLPSLKVVLDMAVLFGGGWVAGRLGRPRVMAAASVAALGLALLDLTPYLPLNGPWVLRLMANALTDARYVSSLLSTLLVHALMFGSLFAGAHLSRQRSAVTRIDLFVIGLFY